MAHQLRHRIWSQRGTPRFPPYFLFWCVEGAQGPTHSYCDEWFATISSPAFSLLLFLAYLHCSSLVIPWWRLLLTPSSHYGVLGRREKTNFLTMADGKVIACSLPLLIHRTCKVSKVYWVQSIGHRIDTWLGT